MFSDSLKAYLEDHGLKAKYIASKVGCTVGTMSSIVNGKSVTSVERFIQICNVLGVTPTELYYYSDNKKAAAAGQNIRYFDDPSIAKVPTAS